MKYGIAFLFALIGTGVQAQVITQCNFNGDSATTVPGGHLSPTPSTGAGTASLIGGVTAATSFGSGAANGGSSDPAGGAPPNYGWQTTTYAPIGTQSGQRGVQFAVSTEGFYNVTLGYDVRHSNTSSRWIRFDYSKDSGSNWVLGTAASNRIWAGTSGDTWFNSRTIDLSADAGVNDNPNFVFRLVAIFGPTGTSFDDSATYTDYSSANPTGSYASTGTLRWDMVTVSGEPVPEPGTMAALALGVAAMLRRRQST